MATVELVPGQSKRGGDPAVSEPATRAEQIPVAAAGDPWLRDIGLSPEVEAAVERAAQLVADTIADLRAG